MSALRNDDISETLAGFDKLLVHRLEDALVSLDDLFGSPSALHHIAFHDAYETVVGIGIHENLQVHLLAHLGLAERHDTLYHDYFAGLNMDSLLGTGAGDVRIDGLLDRLAFFEHSDMLGEQRPVEGIGMVEIDVLTLLDRHITAVFVVRILRDDNHFAFWETFDKLSDYRSFTRAGTARNADNKHKDIYDLTMNTFPMYDLYRFGYKITKKKLYTQIIYQKSKKNLRMSDFFCTFAAFYARVCAHANI